MTQSQRCQEVSLSAVQRLPSVPLNVSLSEEKTWPHHDKTEWDLVSQTLSVHLKRQSWHMLTDFTLQQSLLNTPAYTRRPVDITHPVTIETRECAHSPNPVTHETKPGFGEFATILTLSAHPSARTNNHYTMSRSTRHTEEGMSTSTFEHLEHWLTSLRKLFADLGHHTSET